MADDKNTVHTPKTFSLEIEKIAFNKRCTHLDAISIYCEKIGIEPVSVAKLLTKSLKEKIEANARDLNYLPKALHPGDDKGATILMGGKRTLKIGDLMGTVIKPFVKLETQEDWDYLVELAEKTIDFWADNALEHERCGEMIERIGLNNFLDGIEENVDVNMVGHPRESSYVRLDDFDKEAVKWYEKQNEKSA